METSSTSHETHDFLFFSSLYSVAFSFRQPVVDVCLSIKTCAAGAHRAELSMQVNHHLSRTKMHLPAFSQFFFVLLVFAPTMVPISDSGLSDGCLVSISKSCVGRVSVFKSIFLVSICCCVPILPSGCRVVFLAPANPFLWQCLFTWRQRPSTWIISSHWKWRSVHDDDEKEKYSNRALTSPL